MTKPKKPGKKMDKKVDRSAQPYQGPLQIDATPVGSVLMDLPPGAMRGLKRTGPKIDKVLAELSVAVAKYGQAAGIPAGSYQTVTDVSGKLAQLSPIVKTTRKLGEVGEETEVLLEDERERAIARIVDAVISTARRSRNDGILAAFEQTIDYTRAAAKKGAATREKKKSQKQP